MPSVLSNISNLLFYFFMLDSVILFLFFELNFFNKTWQKFQTQTHIGIMIKNYLFNDVQIALVHLWEIEKLMRQSIILGSESCHLLLDLTNLARVLVAVQKNVKY
jgi:hypothetical protein